MLSGKLVWFITVQLMVFTGCRCLKANETAIKEESATQATISPVEAPSTIENTIFSPVTIKTIEISTTSMSNNSKSGNQTRFDLIKIFHGETNSTTGTTTAEISVNTTLITNCPNISSVNITCIDQSWSETFKTNYTTLTEAVGASEDSSPFRLQNAAAIAAGVFLISAVIGYFSCVGYRRFLQRKYGNSQILIGEEVYDTTDLRYFEI